MSSVPIASVTWPPCAPRALVNATISGCRPGTSLLLLLGIAAIPYAGWGLAAQLFGTALMLGMAAVTSGTGRAPAIKREVALLDEDELRLRDFSMLNLDGIAASMASIESALHAIITNEAAASMTLVGSALYAITTKESINMIHSNISAYNWHGTILVLAKTCRLQEMDNF